MTECERLVSQGFIKPEFFLPEERCNFLVTTERKKIWAIELDILSELDRVCKKNNLHYYLTGGSMLGAIRHHGMIPWDDDIDIGLFRNDYEKLMTLKNDFRDGYFLQEPGKDNGYYYSFAKLRNSRTTCVCKHFAYQGFNQGMFVDIYPLDFVSYELYAKVYPEIKRLLVDNSTYMRMSNPHLSEEDKIRVNSYSGINPSEALKLIEEMAMGCFDGCYDFCASASETVYGIDKKVWRTSDFGEGRVVDFEGFKFPVPVKSEDILRVAFGDYMKLPPIEKRGDWHGYYLFDPDRPYKQFLKDEYGIES